jgi:hypothetical protein
LYNKIKGLAPFSAFVQKDKEGIDPKRQMEKGYMHEIA